MNNLACHHFRHLDCSLASELVEETFTIYRPVRGAEHIDKLRTHGNLAEACYLQGGYTRLQATILE